MRPFRLLHVTPYSAGAWAYGGIPRIAHALTSGLAAQGHLVTICTTDAGEVTTRLNGAPRSWRAWPVERADGCDLRVFPNLSNRLAYHAQLFLPLGLKRFLATHRREFDVAHLHACRNIPGVLAGRALRAAGIPYVLAPNGTAPILERRYAAKRLFDRVAGIELLRGAAFVLAVSDAERRQLLTLGIDASRIRVVANPVDLEEFSPRPQKAPRAGHSAPVIAYLGKITPRKRVDTLVRAFAHLRAAHPAFTNARLIVAGNDMGGGRDVHRQAVTWGVDRHTEFPGLLRGRDRLQLLADADVVAYASQDEVFGLVPLEAILCGTPVVVADDSGCGEVIARVGGGLSVPPGNAHALAAALAALVTGDGPAAVSMAAAQERVTALFSHHVVCRQLSELYHEVVEGARSTAADRVRPGAAADVPAM
jgi:glycosyltransferase involved in cell wall biosynthesis